MKIKKIIQFLSPLLFFIFAQGVFAVSNTHNTKLHFLSVADIHFDPFITCEENPTCPLAKQLANTPASGWAAVFEKMDKSKPKYYQDTNYSLLKSTLAELQYEASKEKVKFVLVLGDFLAHEFKEKYALYSGDNSFKNYANFVKTTLEFITLEFNHAFPNTDVYMVVGNNDSYENDYVFTRRGKFFNDIAKLWSGMVKNTNNSLQIKNQFSEAGYYAITPPQDKNLRLIILNSVIFSKMANCSNVLQVANAQLAWLHNELEQTQKNKQKAILIMHIPPGIDVYSSLKKKLFTMVEFWQPEYNERFQRELNSYSSSIMAILSAHTHMDWFQILTSGYNENIPVSSTPAISPLFGNNAAFKIYTYTTPALQLQNFVTYSRSLKGNQSWQQEYNFNEIYQPSCPNCGLKEVINSIKPAGKLAEFYKSYYAVGSETQFIKTKWFPYYWCQMRTMNSSSYTACLEQTKINEA